MFLMLRVISIVLLLASGHPALAQSSAGSSRDYQQIRQTLGELALRYPMNASIFELGVNDQGETIVGLKIGDGPIKNLVVATHHGNEYGATEVALASAHDLAANPIAGRTIYLIPVLNISGFTAGLRRESVGTIASETLDPNRDYPGPCGTSGPFRLRSTRALADFIDREDIVSSATLHTSGPIILYPWGFSTSDTITDDEALYIGLARTCTVVSGYPVGNSKVSYSAANGTFEDYAYWKHGIWSLLFEIGSSNKPTSAEVELYIRGNVPGIREFMANAPTERSRTHDFRGTCSRASSAVPRLE